MLKLEEKIEQIHRDIAAEVFFGIAENIPQELSGLVLVALALASAKGACAALIQTKKGDHNVRYF